MTSANTVSFTPAWIKPVAVAFAMALAYAPAGPALADPGASSTAQTYKDSQGRTAVFPQGAASFADQVVGARLGTPRSTIATALIPAQTLKSPDGKSYSLGCNGTLTVSFNDNALIDIPGPDLYIFEVGPDVESTLVEISVDGSSWLTVGPIKGATSSIDIRAQARPGMSFRFVRLTDLASACRSGGYPGADIDAVGAIGSGPAVPLPTRARELSVGNLKIDYAGWYADRAVLQRQADEALRGVTGSNQAHNQKLQEVNALQAKVDQLKAVEEEKRRQLALARDQAISSPPDTLKTPDYRRYEARIARNSARMEQIMARIPLAQPRAKGALVDEYRITERAVVDDRARLAQLDTQLGIAGDRAERVAAAERADLAHLQAIKDLARAISERNIHANILSAALNDYHAAVERHKNALRNASYLGDTAPLVTSVRVRAYEATLWSPEADLKHLETQIAAARAQMWFWDGKRQEYRAALISKKNDVDVKTTSLIRWQRASIGAQFGVELGFTATDIALKFKEGGTPAALGEAYKKIIENLIWPPSYLDANNLIPPGHSLMDSLEANAPDPNSALEKRAYKSGVTSPVTKAIVTKYVRHEAGTTLQDLSQRMVHQSWLDSEEEFLYGVRRNFDVRPLFDKQKALLRKAEENLAKATSFRGVAKSAVQGFAMGLVKDAAKHEIKQAVANMFEGEEFAAFNAAQMQYGSHALLLRNFSNYYWQSFDLYHSMMAQQREILQQYDPANAMKINPGRPFSDAEDVLIEISNRGSDPHHPNAVQMDVTFGGVKAERLSGQRLIFRVPTASLKSLPAGPQALTLRVRG